jgi:hypothetical protein
MFAEINWTASILLTIALSIGLTVLLNWKRKRPE